MTLLAGKTILVTGILTESSIGFHVARVALEQGADVVITGYGRLKLVERIARRLPRPVPLVELDVTNTDHLDSLAARVGEHTDRLDGVVHSIAFAPQSTMGGQFLSAPWSDAATALHVSAFSLKELVVAAKPMMRPGSAVVGMDFDASVTWQGYDWMGVAKAALESCARYVARDVGPQGIRVNLVAAGPLSTMAARSIPAAGTESGEQAEEPRTWSSRAPLGWQENDIEPVAKTCVALLSDWFPSTTGQIVHADGGAHAVGM